VKFYSKIRFYYYFLQVAQHIQQHLSPEQQNELLGLMNAQDDTSSQQSLP
jgi:hypothetical protein